MRSLPVSPSCLASGCRPTRIHLEQPQSTEDHHSSGSSHHGASFAMRPGAWQPDCTSHAPPVAGGGWLRRLCASAAACVVTDFNFAVQPCGTDRQQDSVRPWRPLPHHRHPGPGLPSPLRLPLHQIYHRSQKPARFFLHTSSLAPGAASLCGDGLVCCKFVPVAWDEQACSQLPDCC